MARILIEAATLSWSRSASNPKADRIVTACAQHWGYTGNVGDKQAVLDFFGTHLLDRLQEIAAAEEDRQDQATTLAANVADRPKWENGS